MIATAGISRKTRRPLQVAFLLGLAQLTTGLDCNPKEKGAIVQIFGEDSRRDPICDSQSMARRAMAVADINGGCTAFLVSPENHVLTAAHCFGEDDFFWSAGRAVLRFGLQARTCGGDEMYEGPRVTINRTDMLEMSRDLDFILFRLRYDDIAVNGWAVRWLTLDPDTRLLDLEDSENDLYVLAYNPEFGKLMVSQDDGCQVMEAQTTCDAIKDSLGYDPPDDACFDTECDAMEGNSGGPVLLRSNHRVVGMPEALDLGSSLEVMKIKRIYPQISGYLPTAAELADNDGDGMPNVTDNCPAIPNTGSCTSGRPQLLGCVNCCLGDRDCDSRVFESDGVCAGSQVETAGDGIGDACSRPDTASLSSPTHVKGQPSCEQRLTVEWPTPASIRGIAGYSVAIVDQDDPEYDTKRWPNEFTNLDGTVTSYTTWPLGPGHTWEFNLRAVDNGGLWSEFYSSFWAEISDCTVTITRPREGDVFEHGEWVNVFWEPVSYGGNDVGAGYNVESVDLLKGTDFVVTLTSNLPNTLAAGFSVPVVDPDSDYRVRVVLDRNSQGDVFPDLPEQMIGVSEPFTIVQVP